jgi:outer membrane protein assembly factor BamB
MHSDAGRVGKQGLGIGLLLGGLLAALGGSARGDDWPQWLGPQRDGIWREQGIAAKLPAGDSAVRWRFTQLGGGYSGPAVAQGRVYVTDRVLAPGVQNPLNPFSKQRVVGQERVLCLDEKSGQLLWKYVYDCPYQISYPAGPRATPLVAGGRVYTLGAMGDLLCLDAASGRLLWAKNLPRDYRAPVPLWGFAASPLLDGERLICLVGGPEQVVVAFHKDTGQELWHALSAPEIGYSSPILINYGGKRQLIVWHPKAVVSLDPESGKVYWSQPFPARGQLRAGMSIATPRFADGLLFVTAFYNGSLLLRLDPQQPRAEVLWQRGGRSELPDETQALHAVMATPFLQQGYIYGVCSYGELRCLKADTGERLWMTRAPTTGGKELRWGNAFLVAHGAEFFLFNELGDLIRARLTPKGYEELDRMHLLDPTNSMARFGKEPRLVVWSHPAFANRCVFARNDRELVCVSLAAGGAGSAAGN